MSADDHTLQLLTDLHLSNPRQGPGSDAATLRVLSLAGIDTTLPLRIADIGCGTGAASVCLAQHTKAHITAVDFVPAFLDTLAARAKQAGVADRITTLDADMADLPFEERQFDVLWAEGAIYNIGFTAGVQAWRKFLTQGGVLVATEITWLVPEGELPQELREHWQREYPEVVPASAKIQQLEESGYTPIGYFPLGKECWMEEYYKPLRTGFAAFLERNGNSSEAQAIVAAEEAEIALYERYSEYYSYGCYVAKKR
jgi:SAM-dependent methyltransferase